MNLRSVFLLFSFVVGFAFSQRAMEYLDRGLTGVKVNNGVFLSWRVLGNDPADLGFNLYRDGVLLNNTPITGATNYSDPNGTVSSSYTVAPVLNNKELSLSEPMKPWAQITKRVPLNVPAGGTTPQGAYTYSPNDGSPGDLDGDGQYDLVLKWDPSNSHDNSNAGYTGNVIIDGIKLDGTLLWRIDLGKNIRAGAHYTQFMVADYDLDGKAEIILKTAPGVKDGKGNYLSKGPAANDNDNADYRNSDGFVIDGPEYITVFSGEDGRELATETFVANRYPTNGWGKNTDNTNRVDRFVSAVAYLDGVKPSAVTLRGYYGRMTISAWDWDGTALTQRWYYNAPNAGQECHSQGNHSMMVADVDSDGRDEIIQGGCAVDEYGKFIYRTGLGHGDANHISDLLPSRPGLEVWQVHEDKGAALGYELHDAKTGEILFGEFTGTDNGRGMAADIDASHEGYEMWSTSGAGMYTAMGSQFTNQKGSSNFRIYWDGDLQDELLDAIGSPPSALKIEKWNGSGFDRVVSTDTRWGSYVGIGNNWTKANPVLVADLFGDWREEMILRESDNSALIFYTTVTPTNHRLYTLMHDPHYRLGVATQNSAYNQPAHLGFWLGAGIDKVPTPNIYLVNAPLLNLDCNGDKDGVAILDNCGRCVSGNTGENACANFWEAENFCMATGEFELINAGSIDGYYNGYNQLGSNVNWVVNSEAETTYTLTIRHANGDVVDRPVEISVNGTIVNPNIPLLPTTSWSDWTTVEVDLPLKMGRNNILFKAITANGPANLDRLGLVESGAQITTCEEVVSSKVSELVIDQKLVYEGFDLQGRPMFTGRDLSGSLPSGQYLLRIKNAQGEVVEERLIKSK